MTLAFDRTVLSHINTQPLYRFNPESILKDQIDHLKLELQREERLDHEIIKVEWAP